MTSSSPHLDLDALADALAGEGSAADAGHLVGCATCAGRLAELRAADAAVLSDLAALPVPALPADVAARLDAALAAQEPLAPPRAASVTALPRRRADRARWLPAAAAAVIVLGGGAVAVSQGGTGSSADQAASTAAGGAAESAAAPASAGLLLTASGADWADPATPATALPQVLNGAAGSYQLSTEAGTRTRGGESAEDSAAAESQDSEDATMAAAPSQELPDGEQELARLRTAEGLDACLSALLPAEEPGTRPLAVDYASYDGQPALAVVLPDPDPAQAAVFVVGADCGAADADVLLFRRAPLPQPGEPGD